MPKRFLKINVNYRGMVNDFFNKYPNISENTYSEICDLYYSEFYWPSNSLETELEKLYGWKCNSIIFPLENTMQTSIFFSKWCEYNNIQSSLEQKYDRLIFQIVYYNPDIIYIHEISQFTNIFFEQIRFLNPNIKIIGWNCDSTSFKTLTGQKYIDNIYTCSDETKEVLLENRFLNVTKVNHMFEPKLLKSMDAITEKIYDVLFIGKLEGEWYQDRIDFIKYLINSKLNVKIIGNTDDTLLMDYSEQAIYGKDVYKMISQSKIVLNIHANNVKLARNIRLFEITGMGSMLLTDYKPNMNDLFQEGVEAVTFESFEDALNKISYYLRNDAERELIALNGQKKTLKYYTYNILAEEVYKFSKQKIYIHDRYEKLSIFNKMGITIKQEFRYWSDEIIRQTKQHSNNNKVALYGNGNITKLIKDYIPNLVAIFDQLANNSITEGIYSPEYINSIEFDVIIITAFGYEDIIMDKLLGLGVENNKILKFSL